MNKADEKALKRHPRYAAILAARTRMLERIAAAQREIDAAKKDFQKATPELDGPLARSTEQRAFEALRPKGDKVRVVQSGCCVTDIVTREIENVSATEVRIVGNTKPYRLDDGRWRGGDWSYSERIHEDDLARIKSGELKGWRQRPWER